MATTTPKVMGYLPNDTPPFGQMILLGFQHVLTMFPATVLCALLMGFPVTTVLTSHRSGNHRRPVWRQIRHGQIHSLVLRLKLQPTIAVVMQLTPDCFGDVRFCSTLSVVQAGFVATGIINVIVGLIIRLAGGKKAVDIILPPVITGSVACTIGIGLGYTALNNAIWFPG